MPENAAIAIRAAVAGAPQRPSPSPFQSEDSKLKPAIVAAITKANTKAVGFGGVALVVASYVVPQMAPDLDRAIAGAHIPPWEAHLALGLSGALLALAGRWRRFDDASTTAARQ